MALRTFATDGVNIMEVAGSHRIHFEITEGDDLPMQGETIVISVLGRRFPTFVDIVDDYKGRWLIVGTFAKGVEDVETGVL